MRTFFINGNEVIADPNWSITKKINSRSTLSLKIVDIKNAEVSEGDSLEVYNGFSLLFSGVIVSVEKYEEVPNEIFYSVSVVDNSARADKRRIAKVYENQLAGNIVKDLIYEKLSSEGVTEGDISNGPVIKKAVFNYITISEALDYLKKLSGFNWNIDKLLKLNFFSRAQYLAPFTLNNSIQHSGFRQKTSMDRYRNVQYLRGGTGKTSIQLNELPTPKPDGSSRNFILRFAVAEKPSIEINRNGAGWAQISSSDVGVNGLDKNKKWYFSFGSQTIIQDSSETVLTSVDSLRVTYNGLRNLFVTINDTEQIAQRANKEIGTSGIYEDLVVEKSINDSKQAIAYAQGLISTYGEVMDSVSFITEVPGLEAGQLLNIEKPLYGINNSFLIESVNIRPIGDSMVYSVNCLDGASVGGWEEFYKELIRKNKDFGIAENEVLILFTSNFDNSEITGQSDIKNYNLFTVSDSLTVSDLLTISPLTGEVTIID